MKKLKILTVLGVLMAMGIVACNKGGEEEKPAESGQPSQSQPAGDSSDSGGSQAHTHSWDAGTVTTEPGCETEGVKTYHCSGCQETKTEAIPAKGHTWGELTDVAASDGGVDYKKAACSVQGCGAVKYEVALIKAQKADGKNPSAVSGLDGFVKLGSNGDSITLKFNSDAYGKGKLLIRGSMDYWHDDNNHNENRTLFSGKTNGSTDDNKESPNLEIKVNDKVLTVTNKKTMDELLPQIDDTHPAAKSGNSPVGDIQYGDDLVVGKGLNEIVYTRKDSYNLAVSHLIFVFHPETHADHTMSDWAVVKAETCTEDGLEARACSVCGIKETRVIKAAHKWGEPTVIAANAEKGTSLVKKYTCSACNKVKYEVPMFVAGDGDTLVKNFTLDGSEKEYQPTGSIKLGSSGNKKYSFKVEFEKFVYGMAYQAGSMDQYVKADGSAGANHDRKYTDGGSNGGINFKFTAGGAEVDASAYKDTALSVWLGEESRTFAKDADGNLEYWSLAKDCPIGEFEAEAGVVEFVYTRLGSYNLANESFSFVVTETVHTHQAATEWSSDNEGHWHACTDANCPTHKKFDYVAHTLVADEALKDTDTESTCAVHGVAHKVCSICEKKINVELPLVAHNYVKDETASSDPTTEAQGALVEKCSVCNDVKTTPIPVLAFHTWTNDEVLAGCSKASPSTKDYNEGIKGIKASSFGGTDKLTLTYTSASAKSAVLRVYLSMKLANNSTYTVNNNGGSGFWYHDNNKTAPKEKTMIFVNETKVTAPGPLEDIDYSKVGCTVADGKANDRGDLSKPVWVDICVINLKEGENTIVFQLNDTNYSYYFCGCALANVVA